VLDCAYLSWRYVALKCGVVAPGTGICSWTDGIDCDKVLATPQARAFHVPNALLGFGFFFGALLWWLRTRNDPMRRAAALNWLALWLGIATLMTFWFFWLLARLPAFCPFCPWNHLFTYLAFGAALVLARRERTSGSRFSLQGLGLLIAVCVGQFAAVLLAWRVFLNK
jgi:uncharacterized membrane protein